MDSFGEQLERRKVFVSYFLLEPFPEPFYEIEMGAVRREESEDYFLFFGVFLYGIGSLVSRVVQYHVYRDAFPYLRFVIFGYPIDQSLAELHVAHGFGGYPGKIQRDGIDGSKNGETASSRIGFQPFRMFPSYPLDSPSRVGRMKLVHRVFEQYDRLSFPRFFHELVQRLYHGFLDGGFGTFPRLESALLRSETEFFLQNFTKASHLTQRGAPTAFSTASKSSA